jgi:apolipoprotein N-acyltransferase
MSDGSGKNPVTNVFGSIGGAIMLAFIVMGTLAFIFGIVTGRKPERGNLTSVTDVLSWLGALTNTATRSTVETFAPDIYNKTNTIDGSADQLKLMQPSQQGLVFDAVPTNAKAKSNQTNNAAAIAEQTEVYDVDLNGNPIAPLTPAKKK